MDKTNHNDYPPAHCRIQRAKIQHVNKTKQKAHKVSFSCQRHRGGPRLFPGEWRTSRFLALSRTPSSPSIVQTENVQYTDANRRPRCSHTAFPLPTGMLDGKILSRPGPRWGNPCCTDSIYCHLMQPYQSVLCAFFFFALYQKQRGGKNTKKNGNASTMPEHCRKGRSCQVAKWKPNADHILKSPDEFFKRQKVWLNSGWACVTIWRKWQKARQNAWNWKSATCVKCGHRVMSVSVGG